MISPDAPIAAARAASLDWAARSPAARAAALAPLVRRLDQRRDDLARLIGEETGKPLSEAVFHDVVGAIAVARFNLDAAPRVLAPRPVPLPWLPHRRAVVERRPFGAVLVIGPWNIPLVIPLSLILPSLLGGNGVVFKPSERAPRVGAALVSLFDGLDLPPGLLQLAQGDGARGAALLAARPDKVLFTGSVETGRRVMAAAARFPIPVSLELGGVDALIAREDADLELTASAVAWGATFNGGQACCSVERLFAHRRVYGPLMARIADKLDRIDRSRDLGPAVDARQAQVWRAQLEDAARRGLRARAGGQMLDDRRAAPTLLEGEGLEDAEVWREESFGPIVAARPYADEDELVTLHNKTEYGLTASVFSADVAAATALARRLRVGAVAVNELGAMVYGSPELPWGGVGASGFGRSHGEEGLLDATWPQVLDAPRGPLSGLKRPWWYPYDEAQAALLGQIGAAMASDPLPRAAALARVSAALARLLSRAPRL